MVFPDKNGKRAVQVSDTFNEAVNALGLNEGITDRRQKVCFHTCRHSFASWLAESGTDIYKIKELLGHSTLMLTERYSHLTTDSLAAAVKVLDLTESKAEVRPLPAVEAIGGQG